MITADQLRAIYGDTRADECLWAAAFSQACERYEINTPLRIAAFLAQVGHESGRLRYTREIWGPTPAQKRYEGRIDLGNIHAGDGKRYMGRGPIQITGRANYQAASDALGTDFVSEPELLEQPEWGALAAGWFWDSRKLNTLADQQMFVTMTKRINGGTNGLSDRITLYERAKQVLGA